MTKEENKEEYKIWICVRSDLSLSFGKWAAQIGHGVSSCLMKALIRDKKLVEHYQSSSMPKITVKVKSEKDLFDVVECCKTEKVNYAFIVDAGRTETAGPTPTLVAFGPCLRSQLPIKLSELQLLNSDKVKLT